MSAVPVVLTYCEPFPSPFSNTLSSDTVNSSVAHDGRLTVTLPGGDPPAQLRWAAMVETGLRTAPLVAVGLMAAAGLFSLLLDGDQLDRTTRLAAGLGFSLFSIGIALLTWKTRYDILLELLSQGREHRSVLYISDDRLVIRMPGAPGEKMISISRQQLREIEVEPGPPGYRGASALLDPRLLLIQTDGHIVHLMPASADSELRSVASILRRAYGI